MKSKKELVDKLIEILCAERGEKAPNVSDSQKFKLFRALVNVRAPKPASREFLRLQDEYLQAELRKKGTTDIAELKPVAPDVYIWRGDITTLKCDGIVNAANSQMLGCFYHNHGCIDNAIHTFAGVQLRLECAEIMSAQGGEECAGKAKITGAYNLPCRYVLHTVGPIVCGRLNESHEKELASCYRSCLQLAEEKGLQSLAFCCISTGEFRFPNERAAQIAIQTVTQYKRQTQSKIKVVFNVFTKVDYDIYARLLKADKQTENRA